LEKLFNPHKVEESLLNKKQASNARESVLREERGDAPRANIADQIHEVLTKYFPKNKYVRLLIFKDKDQLPIIILYDDDMIADMRAHCGTGSLYQSVLGIDKTFNLSNCLATIFVYKQKNLVRPSKKKNKLLIHTRCPRTNGSLFHSLDHLAGN
jgi:hypothetical protein